MTDQEEDNRIVARGAAARELLHNQAFISLIESFQKDKVDAIKEMTSPEFKVRNYARLEELRQTVFFHDEIVARLSVMIEDGDIVIQRIHDGYDEP